MVEQFKNSTADEKFIVFFLIFLVLTIFGTCVY
jgi:hypothetical protein